MKISRINSKYLIAAMILLQMSINLALGDSPLDYYPLQEGNSWTYGYTSSSGTSYNYSIQVVGQSLKSNGLTYYELQYSSGGAQYERVDSLMQVVYRYNESSACDSDNHETVLYNLPQPDSSHAWISCGTYWYSDGAYSSWITNTESLIKIESVDYGSSMGWPYKTHYLYKNLGKKMISTGTAGSSDPAGTSWTSHTLIAAVVNGENWVGIDDEPALAESFSLDTAYPNPFNAQTTIQYTLGEATDLEVRVFNLSGKLQEKKTFSNHPSGIHKFSWNGTNYFGQTLPSGVYIVQFTTNYVNESQKIVLLK